MAAAAYAGSVALDNFTIVPPAPPPSVNQSFDTTPAGSLPADWTSFSTDAASAFAASGKLAFSPTHGLASNGGSTSSDRAWADTVMPADVSASAAVYLNSLIPAQLFVRGSNLDAATPTYYGVTITRGLEIQLVKVVNGSTAVLGDLKSTSYFSSQWLRVSLIAQGDELQVIAFRSDTQQWLASDGSWSSSPDLAFDLHDGSITGSGSVGVGRGAKYSGPLTFDDFTAEEASAVAGPSIAVSANQTGPVQGVVTFTAQVTGSFARVEFVLNNQVRATAASSPATWDFDSTTIANGSYTLTVRAFDAAGNFSSTNFAFAVNNPNVKPIAIPVIPQNNPNIRVAELAYGGTPIAGATEQNLLKNDIDLVVANPQYLGTIAATNPNTPQLIYSNVSNLYQGLLADWTNYALQNNINPELAFYHVTQATPFSGTSSSSQPVDWFWSAFQTVGSSVADVTSAIRGGRNFNVNAGAAGTTTAIGSLEPFREINVTLASAAAGGWGGTWQYPTAVDAAGNPTAWKTLPLVADGTTGLTTSGRITFDPPPDWKAASIGGSTLEYFVRLASTAGTAAQSPQFATVLGRDYVNANGGFTGTIPAFDYAADTNHDGYLSDAEYAKRAPGMNARFVYETRLFYPFYGQMRFVTNPSSPAVRAWAADFHERLLSANPLAAGIFMDNETGKIPFSGVSVLEPTASYGIDSGALIAAVSRGIAPKWVMSNTAGGGLNADPIAANSAATFEESLLRPLASNWSDVGDVANLVADRLNSTANGYVVLDSLPNGGSPTDPRTQLATLAYYDLVADPERTMLMFFGGSSPSTTWAQHWSAAATVNIGTPTGAMQVAATGIDPLSPVLTYKVFSRSYTNGLVLYKPLSYAQGIGSGTVNPQTATTVQLGGSYKQVNADGTLGPVITSLSMMNGQGAVLVKA